MTISTHFSDSYVEAREKFLAACQKRGLEVEHHLNPKAKGAQGEDLYTDVIRIGPKDASKLLIIASGTHGPEGFCGSGIQVGFLEQDYFASLADDVSILMIHAMNPYGFSHDRRFTEDSVDLNRNFLDFSQPLPVNTAYAEVHSMLTPDDWDGPSREETDTAIQRFKDERGAFTFQAAVTGGQHQYEEGLFFGGQAPTWSREMFESVLQEHATAAKYVGFIDIHTGLGPYGYGELITLGSEGAIARGNRWFDNQLTDPEAGTSTSAPVTGTVGHGVMRVLPNTPLVFIALEYGTYDTDTVLGALRAENWLYHKGDVKTELGKQIKQQCRDAFYANKDDWKEAVWARGCEVVDMALKGLDSEG